MFVVLVVLLTPWRRERNFAVRAKISAPRIKIRDAYRIDLANPYSAAAHPDAVSAEWLDSDRPLQEIVVDGSGGHRTNLTKIRAITLVDEPPWRLATKVVALDGKIDPFGPENLEVLVLEERPDGTAVTIVWSGETGNLLQFLIIRNGVKQFIRRLAKVCASEDAPVMSAESRAPWKSIAISVVAVAAFSYLFGWAFGLMLCGILLVHEFGHWLAMRMTGQPAPRMMLIPFLGGIAVGNHPHKTLFHDAFCSLMGPGFSVLPCLGLAALAQLLIPAESTFGWALTYGELSGPLETVVFVAVALSMITALLNMLQMVPVLPLDGGQTLRAILQSFGAGWARWSLLALTGGGLSLLLYTEDYLLAAILALGLLQAWYLGRDPPTATPMRAPGLATIGVSYVGIWAAYIGAVTYGGWLFGVDFVAITMGETGLHPLLQAYDY